MGLTLLTFIVVPVFIANIVVIRRRLRGAPALLTTEGISLSFALYALFQGLALFLISVGSYSQAAQLFVKLSAFFFACGYAFVLAFVLDFPVALPAVLRSAGYAAAAALAALACWRIVFTTDFILSTVRVGSDIVRVDGPNYDLITDIEAAAAALAALGLLARGFLAKSRIHLQRAVVAFAGIAIGAGLVWFLPKIIASRSVVRSIYALTPVAALVLATVVAYAFQLSRIFDWGAIGRRVLYYGILTAAVGLPVGLILNMLDMLSVLWTVLPLLGAPLVFLAGFAQARFVANRFLVRIGGYGEYRENLESELSRVDLSAGRDEVMRRVSALLSGTLDFTEFAILIEDDAGALRSVYSTSGAKSHIDPGSALAQALERSGATVILKSEALAHPSFASARSELLGLFEGLGAEAVILAREGRRVIGAFVIGPRSTGAEYTDYDYDTFKAIYGKLFVFAYYLKNVARESLLYTVDREIALSDQIIRFALEKVDRLEHPKVDAAWTMKSTRSLGGDIIDFVKLSKDRWFFAIGDISGKGLSASMNMLTLKSMIRTFLRVEKDFVGLVQRINAFIKENLPRGNFFAGALGYFDLEKDLLYYVNCGIPAVLLYSPSFDTFIEVQGEGKILGFVKDVRPHLKPRKLLIQPGSVLVALTDGITDSENLRGERFGKERLRRAVYDRLAQPASAIADGVIEDLLAFTDRRQSDDLTLLVVKYNPRSRP